jgi:signal peptidase
MRIVRGILQAAFVAYVLGVLVLAIGAQAAPATGHGLFAVRSGSMSPALAVADLIVAREVDASTVRPGDIVTIEVGHGTTLTHRVVSVTETDDGPMFATRGDANATTDPVAARAEQLRGAVIWQVPLLGYLLAMLAIPSGIAALFSIGATLLTAVWLLDELAASDEEDELDELTRQIEAERLSFVA